MKRFASPYSSFTPSSSDYREYPTPISGYTDEGDHVFLSFLGLSSDDLQKAGDTIKKATNVAQTAQSLYQTVKQSGQPKTVQQKAPAAGGQSVAESWWTTKRIAIVGAITVTVLVAALVVVRKLKGK